MAVRKLTLKQWDRSMRSFPKEAMSSTLNKMVYEGRQDALPNISQAMTVRSPGFIKSSISYRKSNRSRLEAVWGMKKRKRFTGLSEQEFGRTEKKRAATLKSRGGDLRSKVKPRLRLKPSVRIAKESDFKRHPVNANQAIAVWRKVGYKGLVELTKWNAGSSRSGGKVGQFGIYRLTGGSKFKRAELIHALGDIPKQEKRPWMKPTNEEILRSNVGRKHWGSAVRSAVNKSLAKGRR